MTTLLSFTTKAQTIFQQDFETSPATPVLAYNNTGATATGNGNTPADPKFVSGTQGRQFVNVGTTGVNLDFASVDVAAYTGISFTIRLASFSGTSGNGADGTDSVTVYVSTDGGTTYSSELKVVGNNNARWSFTSGTGTATAAYDGDNAAAAFTPAGGGARTTDGYSTMTLTGLPPSSSLRIRLKFVNNAADELWVVDDARITGTIMSCAAPTTQASAVTFGTPTTSSLPVSWTLGNGSRRVVIANTANTFTSPADGTDPTANSAYNTAVGGEQVVYNGTGASVTVTGLNASTTYYFRVYEANCSGANSFYNTAAATGNPGSAATASPPPPCTAPNASGAISFGTTTNNSLSGSFTASSGGASGYLVFISQNSSAPAISNGTSYTAANAPTGYTFLQDGTGLTFTASGLTASTTYYVYVFSYNNTGCTGGPAYAAATSASTATAAAPAAGLQITGVDVPVTVNFDITAAGSNTGSYNGPVNTTGNSGTLNSNAWSFNDATAGGAAVFGGTVSGGSAVNAGSGPTGIYALQVVNNSTANIALGFQPTVDFYTPGNATLRVQNQTGSIITAANIAYTVYVVNDQPRGNAFNFEYSTDNATYTPVSALNLTSPAAAGVTAAVGNYRTVRLSGLSIPASGYLYLRWTLDDAGTATGSRDEFGLDDISVTFNPAATTPTISGGTYQSIVVAGPVATAGAVTVSESLVMSNGILTTTSANPLTLGTTATTTGASDASYVSGPVSKTGTAAFTFPIGKSGQYRPVGIASISASDTYTAEYFQAPPPNGGTQAVGTSGMNRVSFREYWNVSRTGTTTANLTLTWNANSQVSVPSDIVVAHYNGSTWDNFGGTGVGSPAAGSVTTGVSSFSPFTLGSLTAANPLPLTLISFSGRQEKGAVSLEWTSTCEAGMKQFVVERAEGAGRFEAIGDVAARNGGCAGSTRYTFDDRNIAAGKSYQYRLRMLEASGKESFSATLRFSTGGSGDVRILSNPVAGSLEISGAAAGDLLSVTDMSGRVLLRWTAGAGSHYDVSSLSPGTYLLRAAHGDEAATMRFFKQ